MNQLKRYLTQFDPVLLHEREGRRLLTRLNPKLFALVYLTHHLRGVSTQDEITFSEFHDDLYRYALNWIRPVREPRADRTAFVAPRDSGKSTTLFLVLPLWAAAHGHVKFAAAFAHSSRQAEAHLASFKNELQNNELLRYDFPELCTAGRRERGSTEADRVDEFHSQGGFVFAARGVDSSNLGMKVNERRPDLIILDDIEPEEAKYSGELMLKRLGTLLDGILPLNEFAHVVLAGTVTMMGSIIHQLVKTVTTTEEPEDWIGEQRFACRYFPAIVTQDDGAQRSLWPQKWPLPYLLSIAHTRAFLKNMMNSPMSADGLWWQPEDIKFDSREVYDKTIMVVDGAVTTKKTSDLTGIAVIGLSVKERKLFVREAIGVKLGGEELRRKVLEVGADHGIDGMLVESNQGGDLWYTVFHDMPWKMSTFTQRENKQVRIKRLLSLYQWSSGAIFHEKSLPHLEKQQLAYPNVLHEDVLDATAACAEYLVVLLRQQFNTGQRASARQFQYASA